MNKKVRVIAAGISALILTAGMVVLSVSYNNDNKGTEVSSSEGYHDKSSDYVNSTEHTESEVIDRNGGKMTEQETPSQNISSDSSTSVPESSISQNIINDTNNDNSMSESENIKDNIESDISGDNNSSESMDSSDIMNPSFYEKKVAELVNKERAAYGLLPLTLNTVLCDGAREKSLDMQKNNYFDHNSPTYGSPFEMMKTFGITYTAAGENIAKGYKTPAEVVTGWMNSKGHRENILSEKYTSIGVGYVEDGNYWTQWFARF